MATVSSVPESCDPANAVPALRYKVTIERETFFTTRQCLVAAPGTTRDDLRRVLSDTPSLLQCDGFVREMQGVRREAVADTAEAARQVATNGWR